MHGGVGVDPRRSHSEVDKKPSTASLARLLMEEEAECGSFLPPLPAPCNVRLSTIHMAATRDQSSDVKIEILLIQLQPRWTLRSQPRYLVAAQTLLQMEALPE